MTQLSPKLAALAAAGMALVVVGAGALIMTRNSGGHDGVGTAADVDGFDSGSLLYER